LLLPLKTRYASRMAHPLARVIEPLEREPSRTGAIVITLFGDAIVPGGGSTMACGRRRERKQSYFD
jgi:hypothetical protein